MKRWQLSYCRWLRFIAWATATMAVWFNLCMPVSDWGFK